MEDVGIGVEFYLACFCTECDLLSQWRAYGSAEGRFCISFETEDLPASSHRYLLSQVVYCPAKQRRKIELAIESAVQALAVGSSPTFSDKVHNLFTEKVTRELSFFKDKCFFEEKEWRAVCQVKHERIDQIMFETSRGIIKPFVDLWGSSKKEDNVKLPIVKVWVGKSNSSSLSIKSAKLLLTQYGYPDDVAESIAPIRDL
jgi:hypothetical protein